MEGRPRHTRPNPAAPPSADNPDPLESSPSPADAEEVAPRYWAHSCPRSAQPGREWHQDITGWGDHRVREGTPCALLCGQAAHRDTALLNRRRQAIALLGGRNLMRSRLEPWWMRCSLCGNTWRNYLAGHPFVKGRGRADLLEGGRDQRYGSGNGGGCLSRDPASSGVLAGTAGGSSSMMASKVGVATKCASCGTPFSGFAVEINRYGEEVAEVLRWDNKYYGVGRPDGMR